MSLAQTNTGASVTVGRWRGTYLVPPDYSAARDLQQQLDTLIASRLAQECGVCLEQILAETDPTVWRIKKLALDFSLGRKISDPDELARDWALRLAATVHNVVDRCEQNESILRFPNRTAFVAQFITDLAASRCWDKWYYEEFHDLRVLSDSQAMRTVLLRGDIAPAEVIFQLASTGKFEAVLQALHELDAKAIYDACFESGSHRQDELDKWTAIAVKLWSESPLGYAACDNSRFRDALRLLARTASSFATARNDRHLKAAIDALLDLRGVLAQIRSPQRTDSVIRSLATGDLQLAANLAHSAGSPAQINALLFFAERMHGDADWGAQVAAVILGDANQQRFLTPRTVSEGESFLSPFGGIFLLGPSFQALQLARFTHVAAEPFDAPEQIAPVLCHLAILKCLGRSRCLEAADDPALRLFSGFDGLAFREALQNLDPSRLNLDDAQEFLLQTLADLGTDPQSPFADTPSPERQDNFFSFSNVWPEFDPGPLLDSIFSLIASAALKHFARKLPGFRSSSPEYLYQNFLAGLSGIRWTRERLEVRLPNCPLSLILRMTGLQQQVFELAWLKGIEVWLLPCQE